MIRPLLTRQPIHVPLDTQRQKERHTMTRKRRVTLKDLDKQGRSDSPAAIYARLLAQQIRHERKLDKEEAKAR